MHQLPVTIELNPREKRLYDRLRTRIVETPPEAFESSGDSIARSGMRDLLLLFPDLTILLIRLLRDSRVPILEKGIALAGVAYVLSPIDVLPAFFDRRLFMRARYHVTGLCSA